MQILEIATKGYSDIVEITSSVADIVSKSKIKNGLCHLFVIGSTASSTTCENDTNIFEDIREVLEEIVPYKKNWRHHKTWNDDNGAAHIRASMLGPDLTIPISNGQLILGTWQSIILIECDTRGRGRKIAVTIVPEVL